MGIFAVSIGTVILPDLSGLAKKEAWSDFNRMLIQSTKIMALISIPITFLSLLCGEEIISLVYKSKKFSDDSVRLTLAAFRMHIVALFFIALNRILSPAFYAQGNTKSPTLAGILGFAVNIILAFFAVFFYNNGTGAPIALALSVASFSNTIFLFIFLRKNQNLDVRKITFGTIFYSAKLIAFSLIACIPAFFVRNAILPIFEGRGRLLGFGGTFFITAIVYGLSGIFLLVVSKDEIVRFVLKRKK